MGGEDGETKHFVNSAVYVAVKGSVGAVASMDGVIALTKPTEGGMETNTRSGFQRITFQSYLKTVESGKVAVVIRTKIINELTGALTVEETVYAGSNEKDRARVPITTKEGRYQLLGDVLGGKKQSLTEDEDRALNNLFTEEITQRDLGFKNDELTEMGKELTNIAQETSSELSKLFTSIAIRAKAGELNVRQDNVNDERIETQGVFDTMRTLLAVQGLAG